MNMRILWSIMCSICNTYYQVLLLLLCLYVYVYLNSFRIASCMSESVSGSTLALASSITYHVYSTYIHSTYNIMYMQHNDDVQLVMYHKWISTTSGTDGAACWCVINAVCVHGTACCSKRAARLCQWKYIHTLMYRCSAAYQYCRLSKECSWQAH